MREFPEAIGYRSQGMQNAGDRRVRQMSDLTAMANKWNPKTRECRVIIETPKGTRNKFRYAPDLGLFELGGLLPEGMFFPFDFGFVPGTLADDGDPIDVMVLMDEPAHVGCVLDVRIVGVIEAEQADKGGRKEANNRLLAVAVHSYTHENAVTIRDIDKTLLDQLDAFFVNYNKSRGKKFRVKGRSGPKGASRLLEGAIADYGKDCHA
jgi:inorganic pyrophosphatase